MDLAKEGERQVVSVRFHGKTGTIGPVRGEVSVVAVDEEAPIVVAVITRSARSGPNLAAADAAIGRIAELRGRRIGVVRLGDPRGCRAGRRVPRRARRRRTARRPTGCRT